MIFMPPTCAELSLRPDAAPEEKCGAEIAAEDQCLAHLPEDKLAAHLDGFAPGASISARKVVFTAFLLRRLLNSTTSSEGFLQSCAVDFSGAIFTQSVSFRNVIFAQDTDFQRATFTQGANFSGATFTQNANFSEVTFARGTSFLRTTFARDVYFHRATFTRNVNFRRATFTQDADFYQATFTKGTTFDGANFTQNANFGGATFTQSADFRGTTFTQNTSFRGSTFTQNANFRGTTFTQNANFQGVTFTQKAEFSSTIFEIGIFGGARLLGDTTFRCAAEKLIFDRAEVQAELVVEGAIGELSLTRLRSHGRVVLRLRGTTVDAGYAICAGPLSVHGLARPFEGILEAHLPGADGRVQIVSLRGVDAERLVLTDVDLTECRFAGIHRLDQIVLDGRCVFSQDPPGSRQVLAEEHYWRAAQGGSAGHGWTAAPDEVYVVGPERVQVLYRQLRKAFEEGKDEPGAADFYYGEMEMRRAAANASRRPDRWLLFLYWVTSGYALRVRRALSCLGLVIVATIIALTLWGFPAKGKDLKADGTLTAPIGAQPITVTIRQTEPIRNLDDRLGKSIEITINAVIFRAPDAELTTVGKYINIAARLLGPLFLGFSLLAIRNRVKR